ncbi:hypothetical protein Gotur_009549 [Gossypium turneri]
MVASLVAVQLFVESPVRPGLTNRSRIFQFFGVKYVPKRPNVCICCLAEDDEDEGHFESLKLSDALFSGAVAERINGRLAMIGFVAATAVELSKGQDLLTQITSDGGIRWMITSDGGIRWMVRSSMVIAMASWIPLLKGMRIECSSVGIYTSDAELWNGRFAMLGLVFMAFHEYLKGGALF